MMAAPVTRNLTILLTDIKGFTDKTSRKTRSAIQDLLDKHKQIVLPVLEGRGGKLIKTIGDAFLMAFESPTDAVLAGVAVQGALAEYNSDKTGDDRIEVRIAINVGEVNLSDNDVFGEAVNITARIEGVAEAGEVFFTEAVYLAMNKREVPSSEVGLLQLKGIPEKVRVYKVKRETPVSGTAEAAPQARKNVGDLLRGKAQAALGLATGAPAGPRPPLKKRAVALLIDAFLCVIVAGFFSHGDNGKGHVKVVSRTAKTAKVSGRTDGPILQAGEDGAKMRVGGFSIQAGENGVTVVNDKGDVAIEADADDDDTPRRRGKWPGAFTIVFFVYSFLCLRKMGTTPGGRIGGLAVVSEDGGPMSKRQALLRAGTAILSGYALMIGYLWALWEKDGRGWHDLLSGTKIIEG